LLNVTAAARELQRCGLAVEKRDMIRKATETAEHHVLITGKLFAGTQGSVPLALQDRYVVEQFGAWILWLFVGHSGDFPYTAGFLPDRIQEGRRLMRCKRRASGMLIWRLRPL
jgi:hypothetical protein